VPGSEGICDAFAPLPHDGRRAGTDADAGRLRRRFDARPDADAHADRPGDEPAAAGTGGRQFRRPVLPLADGGTRPDGGRFPNGRRLADPVIDVTLAALFLDLTKEPVTRFVALPLNPPANDVPFRTVFPYLAPAQGNPPLGPVMTSGFNFRTDPPSAYVRVDRMGMPAVATAIISSATKTRFNDADPRDDVNLTFLDDISYTLKGLTDALSDDLAGGGFRMCATRKTG
jgi:hypothetical protein